jgi:hypothetical protein
MTGLLVLTCRLSSRHARCDEKLTPADPDDLAQAIAFALQYSGRKRIHHADEYARNTVVFMGFPLTKLAFLVN